MNAEADIIAGFLYAAIKLGFKDERAGWPVVLLEQCLPPLCLEGLARLFDLRLFVDLDQRKFMRLPTKHPITRAVRSKEIREIVEDRIGVRGVFDPRLTYDRPGVRIGTHPDIVEKAGTIQVYLEGDKEDGTVIRDRRGQRAFKVPFAPNAGYMFKREDTTFHSLDPVKKPRWSLLVPIWKDSLP